MLSRLVFGSRSVWKAANGLKPMAMRPMSSYPRVEDNLNPPLLPQLTDVVEGERFDPKKQSLEEFLNVRFGPEMATINDDKKPERDVKNFPRVPVPIWPDRTRLYMLPESWFDYFYQKTGVTGPYVFFGAFGTFLMSKEFFIIEHEFFTGVSLAILTTAVAVKFGPAIRQYIGTNQDAAAGVWDEWQKGMVSFLNELISAESVSQDHARQQKILFDAKRENVRLQLEAEFRRRQMAAYTEVRNRLEYMLAKQVAERQYQQQHMVNWIIDGVQKGITAQQEKEFLQKCLVDLKQLSTKHKISLT